MKIQERLKNRFEPVAKLIVGILIPVCIITIIISSLKTDLPADAGEYPDYIVIDDSYPGFTDSADPAGELGHTYSFIIERVSHKGEYLAVWLEHWEVLIRMDDEIKYDSTIRRTVRRTENSPGCYWALVPIGTEDEGSQVTIITRAAYDNLPEYAPSILLSSLSSILAYCLSREWFKLITALSCIIMGIIFSLLARVLHAEDTEKIGSTYMGLYIFLVGAYRLLDMPIITLIFNEYSQVVTFLTLIVFLICPHIFYRSLTYQRLGIGIYAFWSVVFCILCLICMLLQISGIRDLRQTVDYLFILEMISYFTVVIVMLINHVRGIKYSHNQWIPPIFILMFLSQLGDFYIYQRSGSTRDSSLSLYTALIYGILSGITVIRSILDKNEELRLKELEISDQRGEMLISQIRPHFIYNTMNTIYSLCDIDVELAKGAIHDFSGYLRLNFQSMHSREPVEFEVELQHIRFYLSIEQLRFGEELEVEYDIRSTDFKLPPLSLQPVVENAVRHGLRHKNGEGHVKIATYREDSTDYCIVEDDGVGFDVEALKRESEKEGGKRMAIDNVRARIEQMCHGSMEIESVIGQGTRVIIGIPLRDERS